MVLRYIQAHSEWICQVGWTGPAHYIISAAQSPAPSLLIQHVWAQRKQYVFRVRMVSCAATCVPSCYTHCPPQGVSCFAYSHCLEVLATGSLDHVVRLWTPFSPQRPVACLTCHISAVVGVAIATEPRHLFSLAQDLVSGTVHLYSQPLHTVLHSIPLPASRCVCGTLESTICCRQCLSSSHLPSGCLTSVLPRSPLSPFPNPPSLWPATSMLPGSLSAQVKPSPDTEWLPCMLIILISGATIEGAGSDVSHTNPVCAVAYSPLLDQLVSVYLPTPIRYAVIQWLHVIV